MKSRYTYDDHNEVLINKHNFTSNTHLNEIEGVYSYRRLAELAIDESILDRKFNAKHLKDIHKYIFQDIYYDAKEMKELNLKGKLPLLGELRIENIAKGTFQFANALFIDNALNYLLGEELKKDKHLKGLTFEEFIPKLTYYMAELNCIHPFREGNGRTTREFIRQLALNAGYKVNWSLLENRKDEFMDAMILSVRNTANLEIIMASITQNIK